MNNTQCKISNFIFLQKMAYIYKRVQNKETEGLLHYLVERIKGLCEFEAQFPSTNKTGGLHQLPMIYHQKNLLSITKVRHWLMTGLPRMSKYRFSFLVQQIPPVQIRAGSLCMFYNSFSCIIIYNISIIYYRSN